MRRPTDLLLLFGYAAGLGSIAWMLFVPAAPVDVIDKHQLAAIEFCLARVGEAVDRRSVGFVGRGRQGQ